MPVHCASRTPREWSALLKTTVEVVANPGQSSGSQLGQTSDILANNESGLFVMATSAPPSSFSSSASPCPLSVSMFAFQSQSCLTSSLTPSPVCPGTAHLFPITSSTEETLPPQLLLIGSWAFLYIVSIFLPSLFRLDKLPLCKDSIYGSLYTSPLSLSAAADCVILNSNSCSMCHISVLSNQKCLLTITLPSQV